MAILLQKEPSNKSEVKKEYDMLIAEYEKKVFMDRSTSQL
jgi:hypothetical protein